MTDKVAFDDVAAHDIQWGSEYIDWMTVGSSSLQKQAYVESSFSRDLLHGLPAPSVAELTVSPARAKLFYGLDFLYQLDQAKTYPQRRALLCRNGDSPPPRHPHARRRVLARLHVRRLG